MKYRLSTVFALLLFPLCIISGQTDKINTSKESLVIERITVNVNFDGVPDEDAWEKTQPLQMVMHSPVFGEKPSEISDIRVVYDDKFLYVGAFLRYNNHKPPGKEDQEKDLHTILDIPSREPILIRASALK